jgi:hypothetical protein
LRQNERHGRETDGHREREREREKAYRQDANTYSVTLQRQSRFPCLGLHSGSLRSNFLLPVLQNVRFQRRKKLSN